MLEQKAEFLKFDSNLSTLVVEQQYKNVSEINRLNASVYRKISLSFVRKHLYSIKDIIAVRGAGRSIIGEEAMFIYSCSAQLISFEIVI